MLPLISIILSLAYPLPKFIAEGSRRHCRHPPNKCFGSAESLLGNIFTRCAYAIPLGFLQYIIAQMLLDWVCDEFEAVDDFVQLCSNLVGSVGGPKKKRDKVPQEFPQELVGEIGKHLESRLDISRFRSVCKGWRSSLPCPTRFQLSVPPPPNCDVESRNMPYLITEVGNYLCRGFPYVLTLEEVDRGCIFRARYVHRWRVKCDLSLISWAMNTPKHRRSRISHVAKGYRLHMCQQGQPRDLKESRFVNKIVVISSNAEQRINPSYSRASDLSVVALLSSGWMEGRLALLRLRGFPEDWHWDTNFCTQVFEDIGTCGGKLCTLDPSGRVFVMDYHSLRMLQLGPPLSFAPKLGVFNHPQDRRHLFESGGELYAADAVHYQITRHWDIFKLSLQDQKWIVPKNFRMHLRSLSCFYI